MLNPNPTQALITNEDFRAQCYHPEGLPYDRQ